MNKKGEIGLGTVIVLLVGIVFGLVVLQASAVGVGQSTNTYSMNRTFTAPAVNSTIDLQGQELLNTPFVTWNHTCSNVTATIGSANYTIAEGISTVDGLKRIRLTVKDGAALSECGTLASQSWRISYNYGPEGYIEDGGARGIAGLIIIFAALAIAIYTLYPTIKEYF